MRRCIVGVSITLFAFALGVAPAGAVAGFGDVDVDRFYADAVQWMVDNAMTDGTSPGCFSPDRATTRGEVAALIHRSQGAPAGGAEPFDDVAPADWFAAPVAWMVSEGITTGTTPTTFEPDRFVTRAEVATFLHRAAGLPPGGTVGFDDVAPDAFYAEAVGWMVREGITTGTSESTFSPDRNVTRGEIATFLYRAAGAPPVTLAPGAACASSPHARALLAAESQSMDLLAGLRRQVGVGSLVRDASMDAFARNWSETMDLSGDFRHSGGPFAENIAWWSAGGATPEAAAQRLHDLWVNSPGHYANMTRGSFTTVGIGFWQSPEGGWHATHVFR